MQSWYRRYSSLKQGMNIIIEHARDRMLKVLVEVFTPQPYGPPRATLKAGLLGDSISPQSQVFLA